MSDEVRPVAATSIRLRIDDNNRLHYRQAAEAVATEFKLSRRWQRLVALDARASDQDGIQVVYEISVGHTGNKRLGQDVS